MSLLERVRKRHSEKFATATVATSATEKRETASPVARVAIVAVAQSADASNEPAATMSCDDENAIRSWLALVGETDPVTISDLLTQCETDIVARRFVVELEANSRESDAWIEDRRTCEQCANLIGSRCMAAFRGEVSGGRHYEPVQSVLRRCAGYASSDSARN